jgi:hypothetical protein
VVTIQALSLLFKRRNYETLSELKDNQMKEKRQENTDKQIKVLFSLGETYKTIGAREALAEAKQLPREFLARHQTGNWGIICEDDKKENEHSVKEGFRILSAYRTSQDVKLWVITEADRNLTTVLLPIEYETKINLNFRKSGFTKTKIYFQCCRAFNQLER